MSKNWQKITMQKSLLIMRFIVEHFLEHNMSPTVREITTALNISSTSVTDHYLELLEDAGYITRKHKYARGIRVPMYCEYIGPELTMRVLRDRLAQMKLPLEEI